jgi:hypothetical protein
MSKIAFSVHSSFVAKRAQPALGSGGLDIRRVSTTAGVNERHRRSFLLDLLFSKLADGLTILTFITASLASLFGLHSSR